MSGIELIPCPQCGDYHIGRCIMCTPANATPPHSSDEAKVPASSHREIDSVIDALANGYCECYRVWNDTKAGSIEETKTESAMTLVNDAINELKSLELYRSMSEERTENTGQETTS